MHPPFVFTDHKVDPHKYHPRPHVRRNRPERLTLSPSPGWPPVPLVMPLGPVPVLPSGLTPVEGLRLTIVPPPRDTWREVLGRWMIRTGQRMILTNRPG